MLQPISTTNAPQPAGHYSQAVACNGFLFISGQLATAPDGERKLGSIEEQTLQVLQNIKAIVEAGGGQLSSIVKSTIYVSDISLWDGVNKVYTDFFGTHKPARAIVPTKALHHGFLIEMEAIAFIG